MSDMTLLPEDLRSASLSDHEIVLSYDDGLSAIDHLKARGVAFLGWEGWLLHADGRTGHSAFHQGIISIERDNGEPWAGYVERSAQLCMSSMMTSYEEFQSTPEASGVQLFFCLTCMSERT